MMQDDRCANCHHPHLFRARVVQDNAYVYFCGKKCRDVWMSRQHPNGAVRLSGLALVFFLCLTFPAQSKWDGEEGAMSAWFQSLHDREGGSCCGQGDYHRVNYRGTPNDGIQIEWKGKWYDVPEVAKVKNYTNPTGEGAAFFYEGSDGAPIRIFCLVRAVEG